MSAGRRAFLAGGGAAVLGGCGFRPLYLPEGGSGSVASTELAAVYIPVMPERAGQLLRQALQQRMDGPGLGVAKKYDLITSPAISGEGIAIQRDSSTTRIRLNGSAAWTLRLLNLEHTVLTSGNSRIVDGYNILSNQFFAADMESEAAFRRITSALADQIVLQVGIFLKRRAEPAAT